MPVSFNGVPVFFMDNSEGFSDVEAAIELSTGSLLNGQLVKQVIIPKLHSEMASLVQKTTRFGVQLGWDFRE